jgi:hypothetical protein
MAMTVRQRGTNAPQMSWDQSARIDPFVSGRLSSWGHR